MMQTIVILCDSAWRDWPTLVRTLAIDLYPRREGVEFWDAVNPSDDHVGVFGNWPRFFHRATHAVLAELEERILRLDAQGEDLALILVFGHPNGFAGPRGSDLRLRGNRAFDGTDLQSLAATMLEGQPERRKRLLRIGIFRAGHDDTAGALAKAIAIRQAGALDRVMFLDAPGAVQTLERRHFTGIRLGIDFARDWDPAPPEAAPGSSLRGTMPSGWLRREPFDFSVRLPAWSPQSDPCLPLRTQLVAYVEGRQEEARHDQAGKSLRDIEAITDKVADVVQRAKSSDWLAFAEQDLMDGRRPESSELDIILGDNISDKIPEPPDNPNPKNARDWQRTLGTWFEIYHKGRIDNIRKALESFDGAMRREEIELQKGIDALAANAIGMDDNARSAIRETAQRIAGHCVDYVTRGQKLRQEIAVLLGADMAAAALDSASVDRPFEAFAEFGELRRMQERMLGIATDWRPIGRFARGGVLLWLLTYILFCALVTMNNPEGGALAVLLLNSRKWVFLGLLALGFGSVIFYVHRWARRQWVLASADARLQAEQLRRRIYHVAAKSLAYVGSVATARSIERIARRLYAVEQAVGDERFKAGVKLLGAASAPSMLDASHRRQFENACALALDHQPVANWMRALLASSPPLEQGTLMLAVEDVGGEIGIQSPLRLADRLKISRLRPDPAGSESRI